MRRIRLDNATVTIDIDHPLILLVRERDLATAVIALGEDFWDKPSSGRSLEAAGFDLLLTHLDEVTSTRDTPGPLRITEQGNEHHDAANREASS